MDTQNDTGNDAENRGRHITLADVHAHLDLRQFENDLPDVIRRAEDAGVKAIIQNSLNPESIKASMNLASEHEIVKLALGVYPVDAIKLSRDELNEQFELIEAKQNSIMAIGEVGLDYHWVRDDDSRKRQKEIFQEFIRLAEKTKKPLIVHSREAENDAVDMLLSSDAKAVLHCFNGPLNLAKKAEDSGHRFSIPASIVFIRHFQELVMQTGMDSILAETDCPYMSPFRGKRNEPAFVAEAYRKIAELKNKGLQETADAIWSNYKMVFGE
ncbi:MAG: TatD family hydrolase [Candidatus Woesearchaeota archaeon]